MIRDMLHRTADVLGFSLLMLFKVLGLGAQSKPFRVLEVKRILVIRTDRIGDLILSTPAMKILRDHFPKAHIACLVSTYTKDIVEGNPCLDEVITYDRKMLRKPIVLSRYVAELRGKDFDMAVVLNYAPDAILLAYLSGSPVRVGTRIPGCGWFLTESISYQERDRPGRHEVECVLDVLRNIGIDGNEKGLYIPLSERGESFARRFMTEHGLENRTLVAMHPGSRQQRMRWNRRGFALVADALIEEMGVCVLMIQGPGEDSWVGDVLALMKGEALVTPAGMSLKELASLLKRCSLYIGHGTGPTHMAAALDIPVIALFGNVHYTESQDKWGPWGKAVVVVNPPLSSFETYGTDVLSVDDVLTEARQLIGGH